MGDECGYFASDHWTERYRDAVERVASGEHMTEAIAESQLPEPPDECGRPATADGRCVFHAPPESTEEGDLLAALRRTAERSDDGIRIVGLRAETLEISHEAFGTERDTPVSLPLATVESFAVSNASFGPALDLTGSSFGQLRLDATTFHNRVTASYVHVAGETDAEDATFTSPLVSIRSHHEGATSFDHATFERRRNKLTGATFAGPFSAKHARFEDDLVCSGARFLDEVTFERAVLHRVNALGVTFDDEAAFRKVRFHGEVVLRDATFEGRPVFHRATFAERVDLDGATLREGGTFRDATFDGELSCRLDGADGVIDFRGAELKGGDLGPVGTVQFDCSGATLGPVTFQRADGPSLSTVALAGTRYDGFDFAPYGSELEPDWRLETESFADESAPAPWLTYLRAKNAADAAGNGVAVAEFFRREMAARRASYFAQARTGPVRDRLYAATKWARSWALNLSCGYGERPGNTVVLSIAIIVVYAAAYLGTIGGSALDNLVFSIQTFVAFLFGNVPSASGRFVELLTASEAFFGGFTIALFVFALTRSIHR